MTIVNQNTAINRSLTVGFDYLDGVTIYDVAESESLVVINMTAAQMVHMQNVNSNNPIISLLLRNRTSGTGFYYLAFAFVDSQNTNDLHIIDFEYRFVVLFSSMQMNNALTRISAGINQTNGKGLNENSGAMGIAIV